MDIGSPKPVHFYPLPAEQFESSNMILPFGYIGVESDTGKAKRGDGSTAWDGLEYTEDPVVTAGIAALLETSLPSGTPDAAAIIPYVEVIDEVARVVQGAFAENLSFTLTAGDDPSLVGTWPPFGTLNDKREYRLGDRQCVWRLDGYWELYDFAFDAVVIRNSTGGGAPGDNVEFPWEVGTWYNPGGGAVSPQPVLTAPAPLVLDNDGDEVVIGGLTGVVGDEIPSNATVGEVITWIDENLSAIPADSVASTGDRTFDITFLPGTAANDLLATSDDGTLTFGETVEGVAASKTLKQITVQGLADVINAL